MSNTPNPFAIAALKERRASMSGEVNALEDRLRHLRQSIVHLDATLRLFAPDLDPDSIPDKRNYKRVKLFGQGELNRLIFSALRKGNRPMTTAEVVAAVVQELGHSPDAAKGMANRVRANLHYLCKERGTVTKEGGRLSARWSIAES
jgi:hypothetical protein